MLHTTGGYLLYAATTFKYVFDYHPGDIYWCTADIGWITGHSYVVYGPLANGATSVIVRAFFSLLSASRVWLLEKKIILFWLRKLKMYFKYKQIKYNWITYIFLNFSLKEHHFIQIMVDTGQLSKNTKLHSFTLHRQLFVH